MTKEKTKKFVEEMKEEEQQEEKKQTILESMEQILNTYVTSDSKFKDLDAKRSIKELMKFVGNILENKKMRKNKTFSFIYNFVNFSS